MSEKGTIEIDIIAKNKINGDLFEATASVRNLTEAVKQGHEAVKESSGVFGKLTDRLIKLRTTFDALGSLGRIVKDISAPTVEFQQGLADLSAITGVVGENLDTVAGMAKRIGAESGLGASKAARAFTLLASNIQVPIEQYEELLDKSAMLSHATGMSIDDAASSLASTVNQFGLATSEAGRVINVLAAGSKYGAAEVVDLAQSFKVTGATASALGLDVESTAGALEVLSKAGVKGAEAGTKLRNVMLNLATKMGVDFKVTSLSDALDALRPRLEDTEFLAKTFGIANVASAQFLIQNADAVAEMTDKVSGTATAFEQAEIRNSSWQHTMEVFAAKIESVKISLGNMLGPFNGYISGFGDLLAYIGPLSQGFTAMQSIIKGVKDKYKEFGIATKVSTAATKAWAATQRIASAVSTVCTARLRAMGAAIMRTTVAQKAAAVATKVWTAVQAAFNVVASLNPVGLIVIGITALIAGIVAVVRNWDRIKKAFADSSIVRAIKRIGSTILNAMLLPIQKLLELLSRIPGLGHLAGKGAEFIQEIRAKLDLTEAKPIAEPTAEAKTDPNKPLLAKAKDAPARSTALGIGEALHDTPTVATAGSGQVRSINISIDSLVREFTVQTNNMQQGAAQVRDMVARALTEAVNDVNFAI